MRYLRPYYTFVHRLLSNYTHIGFGIGQIGAVVVLVLLGNGISYANPEMTVDLPGGSTMEFVWIEPGAFLMGSPPSGAWGDDDRTPHQVSLTRGFWMGKYEITKVQWQAVTGQTPWVGGLYLSSGPRSPAVYISSYDVQAFAQLLNEAAGDSLYRLPTEAEWEYASRAGTTTRWSFGDDEQMLADYAWYDLNASTDNAAYAHGVGIKKPNPWGLYDMYGNVKEWCQDWYDRSYYTPAAQIDPAGPVSGAIRILRGGAFDSSAGATYSAWRYSDLADYRIYNIGARLVRMEPTTTSIAPRGWGRVKGGD